jgi:hypothetical protein
MARRGYHKPAIGNKMGLTLVYMLYPTALLNDAT